MFNGNEFRDEYRGVESADRIEQIELTEENLEMTDAAMEAANLENQEFDIDQIDQIGDPEHMMDALDLTDSEREVYQRILAGASELTEENASGYAKVHLESCSYTKCTSTKAYYNCPHTK